jgi:hypothetical protein
VCVGLWASYVMHLLNLDGDRMIFFDMSHLSLSFVERELRK